MSAASKSGEPMFLFTYGRWAAATAVYPESERLVYPILGLLSEAGEVADVAKRALRDGAGVASLLPGGDDARRAALAEELGDVLWYVAAVARDAGFDLDDIAKANLAKLARRERNGTIRARGAS